MLFMSKPLRFPAIVAEGSFSGQFSLLVPEKPPRFTNGLVGITSRSRELARIRERAIRSDMPCYFFDTRDGDTYLEDQEGTDFSGNEVARLEAQSGPATGHGPSDAVSRS